MFGEGVEVSRRCLASDAVNVVTLEWGVGKLTGEPLWKRGGRWESIFVSSGPEAIICVRRWIFVHSLLKSTHT